MLIYGMAVTAVGVLALLWLLGVNGIPLIVAIALTITVGIALMIGGFLNGIFS